MWAKITIPFAALMKLLYNWTGSYGLSLFLFALAVNTILLPFMAKSKKSTMRTTRLQPQIAELQKRHEGNQQKLNEEMQKLYREEGINPMSGCLWTLIPFPILIALYSVIRQPLSRMMYISSEAVTALTDFFVSKGLYAIPEKADAYAEIRIANLVHDHWDEIQKAIAAGTDGFKGIDFSKLMNIDFTSLGMNLGKTPDFRFWNYDFSNTASWLPALGLFLIPLLAAFLSWLSMKVSQAGTPTTAADAQSQASMKSMTLMMPLMSLWFCFIMPAAMGVYWISNSLLGMARDFSLTKVFQKKLDAEDAERKAARSAIERERELKRLETERKHQEGTSEINSNTSKKKIQAGENQKSKERKAALEKEERAARREMLGIEEEALPASQVGNRRYARGRAYDPHRFDTVESSEPEQSIEVSSDCEAVAEPETNKED